MRTPTDCVALNMVKLAPASGVPLYRQLVEAIRLAVLNGTLAAGVRLPATRVLMKELRVSRNTVLAAFEQLTAGGYVVSKRGSGAYVAEKLPGQGKNPGPVERSPVARPNSTTQPTSPSPTATVPSPAVAPPAKLAETPRPPSRTSVLADIPLSKLYRPGPPRPFRTSTADWREFPLELWERLRARVLKESAAQLLNDGDPAGYLPLREALASYLRQARNIRCAADDIVITAGAQQALRLIAGVVVSPGDVAAIEEPGYFGAKAAFLDAGVRIAPLLVDEEGPITPGARRHNTPSLVYTTPAHQFPLGVTMTLPRRLGMLDFAHSNESWVVEDDYDSEFRYDGQAPESLLNLDSHGRVIYIGNTSQLLSAALRIGYVILPSSHTGVFVKAKAISGGATSLVDQATLALFISEGHLARHVNRLKHAYQSRLLTLREIVQRDLPEVFEFEAVRAGLNTVAWLHRGWNEEEVASAAVSAGLELAPLGAFGTTALMRPGVVFGFSAFTSDELQKALARLVLALRAIRTTRFTSAARSSA